MGWSSRQDGGFFLSTVVPGGGVRVTRHPGIVHSEAVIGANIFRDFFSSVRDVVDGRAGGHERILSGSRDAAPDDLVAAAKECIADGPIGIDFDHEVLGEANDMMMVAVSGRAVKMD